MSDFAGIILGSGGCKIRNIIVQDGEAVEKTSDVVFWVVYNIGNGKRLQTPVSKLDMENQTILVPAQFLGALHDRSRSLIMKTDKGTNVHPYGAIIR